MTVTIARLAVALVLAAVLRGTAAGKSCTVPFKLLLPLRTDSHAPSPHLPRVWCGPGPLVSPPAQAEDRRALRCPDRCRTGECQPGEVSEDGDWCQPPDDVVSSADTRTPCTRRQIQCGDKTGRPLRPWVRPGRRMRGRESTVQLWHRSVPRQRQNHAPRLFIHRLDGPARCCVHRSICIAVLPPLRPAPHANTRLHSVRD